MRAEPQSSHPQTPVRSPDSFSSAIQSPGLSISQHQSWIQFRVIYLGCAEVFQQCPTFSKSLRLLTVYDCLLYVCVVRQVPCCSYSMPPPHPLLCCSLQIPNLLWLTCCIWASLHLAMIDGPWSTQMWLTWMDLCCLVCLALLNISSRNCFNIYLLTIINSENKQAQI